jgi:hypothetical protein
LENTDQIKTGKFLYRFAWAIEIIAASIALMLAWFQIYDADGSQSVSEKYMAALPFVAVMLVELTKIPFSRVLFTVEALKWKIIFTIGLSMAMLITFETFLLGFERFQSVTTREIVELQSKITEQQNIKDEYKNQQAIFDEAQETRELDSKQHQSDVDRINTQYDKSRESLDKARDAIFAKNTSLQSSNIELESIRAEIKSLMIERDNEIKRIISFRDDQIKQIKGSSDTNQQSADNRIRDLNNQLIQIQENNIRVRKNLNDQISQAGLFDDEDVFKEQLKSLDIKEKNQINEIQGQISALRISSDSPERIATVSNKAQVDIKETKKSFDSRIDVLKRQRNLKEKEAAQNSQIRSKADKKVLDRIDADIAQNEKLRQVSLNKLNKEFQETKDSYASAQDKAESSKKERDEADKALRPLCVELNSMVSTNQIYRIAMQFYGTRDACELQEKQLSTVKKWWFGSVALVVAGLGTLTAFGSFILQTPPKSNKPVRSLYYNLRRIFYGIRKKLKEPRIVTKEVIKEVAIEKVKIQEVPVPEVKYIREEVKVPVVEKEYVHIPVYTNDPTKVEWAKKANLKPTKKTDPKKKK